MDRIMTAPAPASAPPERPARKAYRDTGQPVIGGVAAGLARHLGLPTVWVRAGFLVLAVLGGSGILFYAGLWLVLPAQPFDREAPGLESAARQGRRPGRIRRLADSGPAVALVALGLGLVLTAEAIFGGNGVLLWAIVLAVIGFGLLWRQADEAQRSRWLDQPERLNPVRAVFGGGGVAAHLRGGAGVALGASAVAVLGVRP